MGLGSLWWTEQLRLALDMDEEEEVVMEDEEEEDGIAV